MIFLKLAYHGKFYLHHHFRPNVCIINEDIQTVITIVITVLNDKAYLQKVFYPAGILGASEKTWGVCRTVASH